MTEEDEREALARVIEEGWGNPTWDGKTLRPIDRQIADAVLAAGFRRQGPPTDDDHREEKDPQGLTKRVSEPHSGIDNFRELHHFETEQALTKIKRFVLSAQEYGDEIDPLDILRMIPEDIT